MSLLGKEADDLIREIKDRVDAVPPQLISQIAGTTQRVLNDFDTATKALTDLTPAIKERAFQTFSGIDSTIVKANKLIDTLNVIASDVKQITGKVNGVLK